jgi:hypothetical protein
MPSCPATLFGWGAFQPVSYFVVVKGFALSIF